MQKLAALLLVFVMILGGCSNEKDEEPLVISTDVWVGAALLYYAHHKGWLENANIEMLQTASISENMRVFNTGASDIFTGTQHEYKHQLKTYPDLVPVILYDRSYGGDVIMSNYTKDELIQSGETIRAFLEIESVSEELLQYFLEYNQIGREKVELYNRSQSELASMKSSPNEGPMLIVTYSPHDLKLAQNGFMKIASSKDEGHYVIDAVYAPRGLLEKRSLQLAELNKSLHHALAAYKKDPKEFYDVVKPYLGNPTYDEFVEMKADIIWMDKVMDPKIVAWMDKINFPKENLLK